MVTLPCRFPFPVSGINCSRGPWCSSALWYPGREGPGASDMASERPGRPVSRVACTGGRTGREDGTADAVTRSPRGRRLTVTTVSFVAVRFVIVSM